MAAHTRQAILSLVEPHACGDEHPVFDHARHVHRQRRRAPDQQKHRPVESKRGGRAGQQAARRRRRRRLVDRARLENRKGHDQKREAGGRDVVPTSGARQLRAACRHAGRGRETLSERARLEAGCVPPGARTLPVFGGGGGGANQLSAGAPPPRGAHMVVMGLSLTPRPCSSSWTITRRNASAHSASAWGEALRAG